MDGTGSEASCSPPPSRRTCLKTGDNPDGPLSKTEAAKMAARLTVSSDSFYDDFMTKFFSAGDELCITEDERQEAIAVCEQASKLAALSA